jgi:hypothetical protein
MRAHAWFSIEWDVSVEPQSSGMQCSLLTIGVVALCGKDAARAWANCSETWVPNRNLRLENKNRAHGRGCVTY